MTTDAKLTLEQILPNLPAIQTRHLDRNLCTCNEVLKRDILQSMLDGADSVEAVCRQTGATDGTACCRLQVERLLASVLTVLAEDCR